MVSTIDIERKHGPPNGEQLPIIRNLLGAPRKRRDRSIRCATRVPLSLAAASSLCLSLPTSLAFHLTSHAPKSSVFQKLSCTSDSVGTYVPDTSPAVQRLLEFLEAEECEGVEATEIASRNGLRGLFAKEDFEPGDYICAIPFVSTILLQETLEEQSPTGLLVSGSRLSNAKALWDFQQQPGSFQAYLDSLPSIHGPQFDPTPDFWTVDQIRQLEVPSAVHHLLERQQEMERMALDYQIPLESLQEAAYLVQSRAFTTYRKVSDTTVSMRTVLIPYLDMLNHAQSANAELLTVETKAYDESFYALLASQPIAAGEEICITYGTGNESCVDLFCKYGFLPTDVSPPNVEKEIWTTTLEQDKLALAKLLDEKEKQTMTDTESIMQRILSVRIHIKEWHAQPESMSS